MHIFTELALLQVLYAIFFRFRICFFPVSIQVLLQKFVHSFSMQFVFNCFINVFNLSMKPAHNADGSRLHLSLSFSYHHINFNGLAQRLCLSICLYCIYVYVLYMIVFNAIASDAIEMNLAVVASAFCLTLS